MKTRLSILSSLIVILITLAACTLSPPEAVPTSLPVATIAATPTLAPVPDAPTAVATTIPPTETSVVTFAHPPRATETRPPFVEHIVQAGETLISIANEYKTTPQLIADANNLASLDEISINQTLRIPQAGASAADLAFSQLPLATGQATILDRSILGRAIEVYSFGTGPKTLIFVGGIHGGYEWNTTVLAYQLIDYLTANPEVVPTAVTLHIIPAANPDGIYLVTGKTGRITASDVYVSDTFPARFNAHGVDLNRNWDCEWSKDAFWRDQPVNPGSAAFSEKENQVLRDFFIQQQEQIQVVVFWHSQATLVSPGSCGETHQPSIEMAAIYAHAASYPMQEFSAYEIHGDASNWLAKVNIPSFSVELTTHESTDWERNREGVLALLALYAE